MIDFTKMRAGTNTRGYLTVAKCRECGRNGEYQRLENSRKGIVIETWTHTSKSNGLFTEPVDECRIVTNAQEA